MPGSVRELVAGRARRRVPYDTPRVRGTPLDAASPAGHGEHPVRRCLVVRVVLGVLAALLAAFLGVAVVELISYAVHPPPEGLDPTDTAQLQAYLATVPAGVMALIAVAHGVGALLGGLAGTAVGGRRAGTAFAVIFVVITVLNLFSLPHPAWFWVLDLVLTVGGVAGGIALGLRRAAG